MDTVLQHDPRTKQNIKEALYHHLYAPVLKAFKARIDTLIVRNCGLMKVSHKSFLYKGELYHCDTPPFPRKANRLSPSLVPDMEDYLKDRQQIDECEMPYVMGFITQVLNASNDFEDYLEVFPPALHTPIRQFIASCPCHNRHLTPAEVETLRLKNLDSITLIKNRMVTNLLI